MVLLRLLVFLQVEERVINHNFVKIVEHLFIVNMIWHQEELSLIRQQWTTHKNSSLSTFFKKKGVQRNDRALLMVKPGYELIICCFALLFIGAIPIIIDPGMGLKSLLKCIKRSKPQTLIASDIGIWISTLFRTSFSSLRLKIRVTKNFLVEAKRKFTVNPSICYTIQSYSKGNNLFVLRKWMLKLG